MRYIPVIGLEIHAELLTKSKVFCSCANEFGGDANERVCPRCSGMPGTLPILNREAVTLAARAGFALNCKVNNYSSFDRKNYFYPDLPKAYQITQFEYPICTDGYIETADGRIRINRIHIEEDAGKLVHDDYEGISMADYNRCGVPLIEIVTEPDFGSAEQVCEFVRDVALRLKYAGVCDARLEQGSLRVDVNISVMPYGSEEFGTRAEIKNLNSIKSIGRAIEYEIGRQSEILDNGGRVVQETRRYNDNHGDTKALRSKEEAHDYRYFPEPDIPPVFISDDEIEEIKSSMPEMPADRVKRYCGSFGLSADDAALIVEDKAFSDFYDAAAAECGEYREVANLMLGTLNRCLNESSKTIADTSFSPKQLAELAKMSVGAVVSKNAAKDILTEMFASGGEPMKIAEAKGLIMQNNTDEISAAAEAVIAENQDAAEDYRSGNAKIFGFLMGQLVRKLGKGANPKICKEILEEKLKK